MAKSDRVAAFLTYLLPVIGWAYVLLARRDNKFAMFHTRQSIGLVLIAVAGVVTWVAFGWIIAWIPIVGPIVSLSLFSLVIALLLALIVIWIIGLNNALQNKEQPLPIIGGLGQKIQL